MIGPRGVFRGSALEQPALVMLVVTPLVLAVALFIPLTRADEWVGWLPGTISIFESIAIVLPTCLAALSAWISGQARAHGMKEWVSTSPRSAGGRMMPALVIVGSSFLTAAALMVTVLFTVSEHFGLEDGMVALDLLAVIPTVTAYVGVWIVAGAWVGATLRRDLAILAAALLPYLWYALSISFFVGKPIEVLAVGDPGTYDYMRPATITVILRAFFWVAVFVLLSASIAGKHRLTRMFAWLLSAMAAGMIFLASPPELIPGALAPVCDGSSPMACLEGSYLTTMPRYREAIDQVWPSIPTAIRPTVIASNNTVVPVGTHAIIVPPVSANNLAPARLIDQQRFEAWVGEELFLTPCRDNGPADTAVSLLIWWRLEHGIPLDGSSYPGDTDFVSLIPDFERLRQQATEFASRSTGDKELWFDQNSDGVLGCDAPPLGS